MELLQQIVHEQPPKLPAGPNYQGLDVLIERCLVKDPDKRPRPEELMVLAVIESALIFRKILLWWPRLRRRLTLRLGLKHL